MREQEKLDLLLKELYGHHMNDEYYSLDKAIRNARIPLSLADDLKVKARILHKAGLIDFKDLEFDLLARITPNGVLFCERTSYAYNGHPIVTAEEKSRYKTL